MIPAHVEKAVKAIEEDGYVVLEDAVSLESLDTLYQKMIDDGERARKETGRFRPSGIPLAHPWLFRDIPLNDMVIAVTHAVLGDGVYNDSWGVNWRLAGELEKQPVHPDHGPLFLSMTAPTPAFRLVINIPLVDFTEENGATEVWPGTHRETRVLDSSGRYGDASLYEPMQAEWRKKCSPHQVCIRRGSLFIRDMRTWHAGMPNRSNQHRAMLSLQHAYRKIRTVEGLAVENGSEDFFEHLVLTTIFTHSPAQHLRPPPELPKKIVEILSTEQGLTLSEIRSRLPAPLSDGKIRDAMIELSRTGEIRREGAGLGARWFRKVLPR
ncbi:MAG: phytanoyl-CoA dioxygenase family protein [Planctomycetes bacterium]|nr:phytanoyl-CoA dioxygenase family protein [Planctomycetota bacterium]